MSCLVSLTLIGTASGGFVSAKLADAGPGLTPRHGASGYIVRIDWTQQPIAGQTFDGIDLHYSSFCIEVSQNVYFGGTYTFATSALENAPFNSSSRVSTAMASEKADHIRRLWAQSRAGLDTNEQYAAFQIAIWKILGYSDPAMDSVGVNIKQLADQYIENSEHYSQKANLIALTNGGYQDQLVELESGYSSFGDGEVVRTPVPTTLLMVMTGLAPLVAYYRTRRMVRSLGKIV